MRAAPSARSIAAKCPASATRAARCTSRSSSTMSALPNIAVQPRPAGPQRQLSGSGRLALARARMTRENSGNGRAHLRTCLMNSMDTPVVLPWWRRRSWIAGATFLIVIACAWLVWRLDGVRNLRIGREQLTIATVRRATFRDFIPLRARVVPRATIYLDAVEGGRVEQVMVEPGDMVEAGQPLVRLSNTELELVVLDREARLIESITQLQARQSSLEQDRLNNAKALARIDYDVVRLERALNRRKSLASESQ